MSAVQPIIDCHGLVHIYKTADIEAVALQGLDLEIDVGEMVAIVGASGSGKTTLMNVLAAVDRPSAGRAVVAGWDLVALDEARRGRYRREVVGYVWQQASLNFLPELTVEENLQLTMMASGKPQAEQLERAGELMRDFALEHRRHHLPRALSGGELRLLAVSVALANKPKVLLADEPTAGIDRTMGNNVLTHLRLARDREGTTIVFVTHERSAEQYVDRVLRIRDGRTSTETRADGGEKVIVDRTGRLQLPRHLIEEVGLRGLARVRREGDGILIVPAHEEEAT
jgi:ABC-type lipoprotein export system ATPase subunit